MKKILTHLTGIAFVLTILLAGSCNRCANKEVAEEAGDGTQQVKEDSTKVDIYLKAILIDGSMHLEMYHEKKPDCPVIDGLVTVVYGGYTVTWRKADNSIKEVTSIEPVVDSGGIFDNLSRSTDSGTKDLWTLVIPEDPEPDTIKYKIHFKVKDHKDTTYIIDPYLKLPKQTRE